jgi:hypothetical protein
LVTANSSGTGTPADPPAESFWYDHNVGVAAPYYVVVAPVPPSLGGMYQMAAGLYPHGMPTMAEAAICTTEGVGIVTLTVERIGGGFGPIAVDYEAVADTASAGQDFVLARGTLDFGHGELTRTIAVPIVNDSQGEPTERFSVRLVDPLNCLTGDATSTTITVLDDDETDSSALPMVLDVRGGIAVVSGLRSWGGDVDWFAFDAQAGDRLWAAVDVESNPCLNFRPPPRLTLLALDGQEIETDFEDATCTGLGSVPQVPMYRAPALAGTPLPQTGTYRLRFDLPDGGWVDPYALTVVVQPSGARVVPENEPNDEDRTANPMDTASWPVAVHQGILDPGDTDVFRFMALADSLVHLSVDGDPERDGTNVEVWLEIASLVGGGTAPAVCLCSHAGRGQPVTGRRTHVPGPTGRRGRPPGRRPRVRLRWNLSPPGGDRIPRDLPDRDGPLPAPVRRRRRRGLGAGATRLWESRRGGGPFGHAGRHGASGG